MKTKINLPVCRQAWLATIIICIFAHLLICITCPDYSGAAFAQRPGTLDSTFGTNGIVTTPTIAMGSGNSVAIQGDGKIVATGDAWNGSDWDFGLLRFNSNGILDSAFDTDGVVFTDFGNDEGGYSVVIQPDGKIVVAGISGDGFVFDFAIARYNSNGSLDTTFNSDGKLIIDFGGNDMCNSAALQADGKIVMAGYSAGFSSDIALARCNSNDTLDNSFDTDGKILTDFGGDVDYGYSLAIQTDGKMLISGRSGIGSDYDIALARYNTNGSLDNTFDSDGKVTTDFGSSIAYGNSVAIQTDSKIVVAGYINNGNFALARYNTDGSLDTTFGSGGKVTTAGGIGYSAAIQSDGKILLAGSTNDIALLRYNSNGSLDTSFGTGGIATMVDIGGGSNDAGTAVAIQADGKIVVAGYTFLGIDSYFVLVRYKGGAVTGIEEMQTRKCADVQIYPNPFSNTAVVRITNDCEFSNEKLELRIYDVLGQQVYFSALRSLLTKSGQADFQLDLSILVSGIYFYQITENKRQVARGKLIRD